VTLEQYARALALAACRRDVQMSDLLAEVGVTEEDLGKAEGGLREQLAGAWDSRKGVLAMKFAAALGAELLRLGPIGTGTPPKAPPVDQSVTLPSETRPHETDLPSFMQSKLGAFAAQDPMSTLPLPSMSPVAEPAPPHRLDGTADMDLSTIMAAVRRGTLPFQHSEAPPSGVAPEPQGDRRLPPSPPVTGTPGGTMNADLSQIVAAVNRGALPFKTDAPAGGSDSGDSAQLPLETYAAVSGALARGVPRETALAKYNLLPEDFDRLAKAWAQRFQREPHLLDKFKELASNAAGR
jgi:hypothetical protein